MVVGRRPLPVPRLHTLLTNIWFVKQQDLQHTLRQSYHTIARNSTGRMGLKSQSTCIETIISCC